MLLGYLSYHPIVRVHLGPLSISPHGVGIAVGFLVGARVMVPLAARRGITQEQVYALLTRAAIGTVIGARLAYVLNHFGDYGSVAEVLKVWKGGISLLGGIFGAIVFALPRMRTERLSFWKVMDSAAPGMAVGIIIGRIGDLIVGDHLGKTTHFFLGYRCPSAAVQTASPCIPGTVVHQTALYDFFLAILLFGLLYRLSRSPRFDGFLILLFGAVYGSMRIVEDFLREDVRHFGLTGSQITSIITVAACLFVLVVRRRTPRLGRWDETGPPSDATPAEPERPPPPAEAEPVLEAEPLRAEQGPGEVFGVHQPEPPVLPPLPRLEPSEQSDAPEPADVDTPTEREEPTTW